MYFSYGEKEIEYLKSRDKVLGEIIEKVGHVYREVDTDLFSSVVHHIVGQQISTKAQETVWKRVRDGLGGIDAESDFTCDGFADAVLALWRAKGGDGHAQ